MEFKLEFRSFFVNTLFDSSPLVGSWKPDVLSHGHGGCVVGWVGAWVGMSVFGWVSVGALCCLHIKPLFLPKDITTPNVRADSSSEREKNYVVTDCETENPNNRN